MNLAAQGVRACVDCSNLVYDDNKPVCRLLQAKFDFVLGKQPHLSAYAARAHKAQCGPEAKLFAPIPEQVAKEVAAIVKAHGPDVGTRVRDAALGVLAMPGNAGRAMADSAKAWGRERKAGFARFGQRVAAARAAWHGILDNTADPPVLLTAEPDKAMAPDPIEEAKTVVMANDQQLVLALEAKEPKPEDTQPAPADPSPLPQTEGAAPVSLAKPADPRQEQAVAQAVALAAMVILAGYICAGLITYSANHRGTLSSLFRTGEATAGGCTECRKGGHCHPCVPPRERPKTWPRMQSAMLH